MSKENSKKRETKDEVIKEQIVRNEIKKESKPVAKPEGGVKLPLLNGFKLNMFVVLSLKLFSITAAVALLLAVVNGVTSVNINAQKQEKIQNTINKYLPEGDKPEEVGENLTGSVKSVLRISKGNETEGYCVSAAPYGFSGPINILVITDAKANILGVEILSMTETPDIGSRLISEPKWLEQYAGKSASIVAVREGKLTPENNDEVELVSGATISSSALFMGVKDAVIAASLESDPGQGVVQ